MSLNSILRQLGILFEFPVNFNSTFSDQAEVSTKLCLFCLGLKADQSLYIALSPRGGAGAGAEGGGGGVEEGGGDEINLVTVLALTLLELKRQSGTRKEWDDEWDGIKTITTD